jgi:hypothetical protein
MFITMFYSFRHTFQYKLHKIKSMRQELDKLVLGIRPIGVTPASHKRGISSLGSMSETSKRLYIWPKTPLIYEGKNIREL